MIRVDRNLQESVNILPNSHLSWQPNDNDFIQHLDNKDHHQLRPPTPADAPRDRSSSLSPAPDSNSPQTQPEAPSSPPLPLAAEEREEQVKEPQREEEEEEETRADRASRLSTPLSELSPPPDDLDVIVDTAAQIVPQGAVDAPKINVEGHKPGSVPDSGAETVTLGKTSTDSAHSSPTAGVLSITNNLSTTTALQSSTTSATSTNSTTAKSGEHKVISILQLNNELLNVCMEFQKKGIPTTDGLYHQYSQRLQSNLAWLAAAADQSRTVVCPNVSLPMVDAPPPVDFYSCERIKQLYSEMPSFFAKEFSRRQQHGVSVSIPGTGVIQAMNPAQKRERTEDGLPDPASKRQNIGEAKSLPSQTRGPPPSISIANLSSAPAASGAAVPAAVPQPSGTQFSLPISNGPTGPSPSESTPQQFHQQPPDASTSATQANMLQQALLNSPDAHVVASTRARHAQLRAAQQQQQAAVNAKQISASMPGGPNASLQGVGQSMGLSVGGAGSGTGQMPHGGSAGHHQITYQQAFQILQNPSHPIIQYLMRAIPGFQGLPQQTQMQKIAMAAIQMQNRNQQVDQQRAAGAALSNVQQTQGVSIQNSVGGMSFPMANATPAQSSGLGMGQQNNVFPAGMQGSNSGGISGAASMSGVNMNPHQRQLLLMQQQQRAGPSMGTGNIGMGVGTGTGAVVGGSGGVGVTMNPQQISLSPQQLLQHQQRMGGGMGVNISSPMMGGTNEFPPTHRANGAIPGIARSTRSPTETGSAPMTPRVGNAVGRGASMGPEDYQRMMMKQHQQGQNSQATMFGSPGSAAQGMMGGNWGGQQGGSMGMGQSQGQNQNPQLQGIQMQGGYGMSSPAQVQHQPQQHQQTQPTVVSLGTFMGGASVSPPPVGVSSPTWSGSPTQAQQQGGTMNGMFSPFSPTGVSLGDIPRHTSATPGPQRSQTPSLAGSQDDYSSFFDWSS
ncbi:hypothetical protein AX15_003133 [Amanita polypyramis BW_CC]|nr:hypothetical protein AX15_003133 [Amanita polypyramis BW_CC]